MKPRALVSFEVFRPAWEHARLFNQLNPVWFVLGTTVGVDGMLEASEVERLDLSNVERKHFKLYYHRDLEIMKGMEPRLEHFCGAYLGIADGMSICAGMDVPVLRMTGLVRRSF